MRFVNELRKQLIETPAGVTVEGIVRARGIDTGLTSGPRRFERLTPVAIVVETQRGVQRVTLPQPKANLLPALLPIAGYFIVRALAKRSRT